MPFSTCSSGLVVTALVTLLLLPAQYYVPEFSAAPRPSAPPPAAAPAPRADPPPPRARAPKADLVAWPRQLPGPFYSFDVDAVYFPTLDLLFTCTLLGVGLLIHLCEWIQRKLMERRMAKLNQYLGASVERLRAWDAQQEQLEATLRMVQNATSEYNLLLFLLVRQHRCLAAPPPTSPPSPPSSPYSPSAAFGPPANCFFDKDLDDEIAFLRNSALET